MSILGPCYVVDVMDGLLACLLVVLACRTLLGLGFCGLLLLAAHLV